MRRAARQPRRPRFSTGPAPAAPGRSLVPPAPPSPAGVTGGLLVLSAPVSPGEESCASFSCHLPHRVLLLRRNTEITLYSNTESCIQARAGLPEQGAPSPFWAETAAAPEPSAFSPGGAPKPRSARRHLFLWAPGRFDWSHLTPRELQNRSWGIQTEERAGRNPYFTLEGREFLILGGSIHYFRVPRASWRDRLLKLRACGFNTVTT